MGNFNRKWGMMEVVLLTEIEEKLKWLQEMKVEFDDEYINDKLNFTISQLRDLKNKRFEVENGK